LEWHQSLGVECLNGHDFNFESEKGIITTHSLACHETPKADMRSRQEIPGSYPSQVSTVSLADYRLHHWTEPDSKRHCSFQAIQASPPSTTRSFAETCDAWRSFYERDLAIFAMFYIHEAV
jgi:hypothetical protein